MATGGKANPPSNCAGAMACLASAAGLAAVVDSGVLLQAVSHSTTTGRSIKQRMNTSTKDQARNLSTPPM